MSRCPDFYIPMPLDVLFEAQGGRCFLCGELMIKFLVATSHHEPDGWTKDHIYPRRSLGAGLCNNIALAHWRCNHEKGNREPTADEIERARILYAGLNLTAFIDRQGKPLTQSKVDRRKRFYSDRYLPVTP